ncbi:MAG: ThuA domain-containing protein [Cyclobacteriaceae bacterium]
MKRFFGIVALLLLGAVVLYFTVFSSEKREAKVLVFSKTEGFRHESIEPGIEAIKSLGDQHDFTVEATEDAGIFTDDQLKDFSTLIFLNTTGDILDQNQQVAMERYLQAGGGFVGVHSAADTEYAWPWYGKLVGAYFNGHPNDPNVREATLRVINRNHPATDSLPTDWTRYDEWYNYKAINPKNQVLIKVDESTYEGGTNGENHPMSWYKEYDGGRAFYTGLGHTSESYSDPLFLNHLLGGIRYAIGANTPLDYGKAYSDLMPEENRFNKVVFKQNLNEPMELDFLDENRIIWVERRGGIHIYNLKNAQTNTLPFHEVHTGYEDGLLGVAVDPNYAKNHWVYLFYSPAGKQSKQHVSRFSLENDSLYLASEKVLLEIATQREECCHSAGSLEFGPEGNLYISLGDNTNPHESDGFGPIDEREGRSPFDAQKSSSNTQDLRGKILRIRPEADGTYSIPEGNLFASRSEGRPEIYIMGNRNPFRFSIDEKDGTLYWGEVGPDAREDSVGRGPRGYDEINMARSAGNYGWPYFIADNKPYHDFDFAASKNGKAFNPEKPTNQSPNNTGAENLPPARPALVYYPYADSDEFPLLGSGARNAMAGPVYYSDKYADSDRKFPDYFDGKPLFYDWMRQWIFAASINEDGTLEKLSPFLPNMEFSNIIDMQYGPDGALYLLEYGNGWFSQNPDAKLSRIEFTAGNRAPIARIEADKTIGGVPLTVQFTGLNSVDYDGDPLSFAWSFSGKETESTEANPKFKFDTPGLYQVKLEVQDKEGLKSSVETEIMVGNEMPQLSWNIQGNRSFFWPDRPLELAYAINVSDAEDGSLAEGSINPEQVIVSFDYLPQGNDQVMAAQGHAVLAGMALTQAGKTLIETSDCKSCHKEEGKSIGPAYKQIAQRYQGEAGARKMLASKIMNGGSGNWGQVAMAAHPNLTQAQASQMVDYILSLGRDAQPKTSAYPPKGRYQSNAHLSKDKSGTYILTASYTDQGGQGVGSLSVQETLMLRHPRMEAETYDEGQAPKFPVKAEDTPGLDEDITIVIGQKDKFFMFKDIDLSGVTSILGQFGLVTGITKGGTVEYRLGSPDGEMIGSVTLEQSITEMGLKEMETELKPIQGMHDLYVVFRSEEEANDVLVTVVNWLEFKSKTAI